MRSRSTTVSKLLAEKSARESYVRAKLGQLIPAQIRALRLREGWTQTELGAEAEMKQTRVSAMERSGASNVSIETLIRLAAACKVGLQVRFVAYSQMLRWQNDFSQDDFAPLRLTEDAVFTSDTVAKTPPLSHTLLSRCFSGGNLQSLDAYETDIIPLLKAPQRLPNVNSALILPIPRGMENPSENSKRSYVQR